VKVLLATKAFPPRIGGVETLCRQLAEGLAERGDDVTVVCYRRNGEPPPADPAGRYRVVAVRSHFNAFELSAALPRTLRRQKFDVCHVHNLHSSMPTAVWATRCRPYVLTGHYHGGGHSPAAALAHPAYRWIARRVVAGAAAVTAVSAAEAAIVRRHFNVEPIIIPNGIPLGKATTRSGTVPGTRRVIAVARLVNHKRVDAVVSALPLLPGFALQVIGDGPEEHRLRQLAHRLGVADRLTITRRLSDAALTRAMAAADVYVNLSEAEAFSYTVLESLAAGTPVVANRTSGLAEWVERFPSAVVGVDPNCPSEVAEAIRTTARSRARVDMSAFDLDTIIDRYRALYRSAASITRSPDAVTRCSDPLKQIAKRY
jgi:glycosyltransferase involved in cell wall biosynthesis